MINSVSICIVCGKEMPAFYKGCSKYVPYLSCAYYFNTLEDCKKRIDKPHIAYVSREALRTFIREEFVND